MSLRRRELLTALAGLPTLALPGCTARSQPAAATAKHVHAQQLSDLYAVKRLAEVEALMPDGAQVVLDGLVFHDWAYPQASRLDATQADPDAWREVTRLDPEGGHVYHGIKLRLPGEHNEDTLHRSGPKVIAFLPYANRLAVRLLKQAYRERFELSCTVTWLGVLGAEIWDENDVGEDDMVGLRLHGVGRLS